MKDGIIKGTGDSRYLKGAGWPATYAEFKATAEAGTLPFDLNGINEAGWRQIGDALSKANLLSDETAAAMEMPFDDPRVTDAFVWLYTNKRYAWYLTIKLADGTPVPNYTLNGATDLDGNPAVTDSQGKCLCVATAAAVIISNSEYIDLSPLNLTLTATSVINQKEVILTASDFGELKFTTGQSVKFKFSTNIDLFGVGGGGGGGVKSSNGVATGGGGGYTSMVAGYMASPEEVLTVAVGAAGHGSDGSTKKGRGGTSSVSSSVTGASVLDAEGGYPGAGRSSADQSNHSGGNGGSGGGGAYIRTPSDHRSYPGGSDGSNGGNSGYSINNDQAPDNGYGQGATTRKWGAADGELCSGGGGAADKYSSTSHSTPGGAGGGGHGSYDGDGYSTDATDYGGGGGGIVVTTPSTDRVSHGYQGVVFMRRMAA